MTDFHFKIDAVDTLMFRDGRPFNQMDAGASEAVSVFPPYPPTLVGAIRAMLWQGPLEGCWDKDRLGNGTDWSRNGTLGPLQFGAPMLLQGSKPVFPVPLHIVEGERGGKNVLTRLLPGPMRECDLSAARLPVPKNDLAGIGTIDARWVTMAGMQKILNGGVPSRDDLFGRDNLWQAEPRVGVGIDMDTRTTSDGRLYMADHVRMASDVSLGVTMTGWENGGDRHDRFEDALRPLAGEHRMAAIGLSDPVGLPEMENSEPWDGGRCVIALSPVVPDPDKGFQIKGLPEGDVVCACLGKPVSIGGWNSKKKKPVPLRQCYPAGSVWFLRSGVAPPSDVGEATGWGFGQVLIGKWQERQGNG